MRSKDNLHSICNEERHVAKQVAGHVAKRRRGRTMNQEHGVTLIELMMVMVIMAIVLSISVPAFNSIGRGSDMRGAVSGVRSTLAQSRQWAITHREQTTFQCVRSMNSTNPDSYFVTNAFGLFLQATSTLPLSVRFQSDVGVTFKTDGSLASGPAAVDISLVSSNAPGKEIQITGLTGGIRVQ
ncbi:MAG: prepilin-type N-terminal cleavage/methylation domain-containing protein [Verrucomicrobia bacterium]|nr:prepilin-type N-terminal cleavage/methylation domain-containing protein [Verrucomicrobiota bacterium]MCG2678414.1 prepilin-type N-terminal cleavage/methylation domain-containing protein [Kiritimatiellia bacterium]